MFDQAKYGDLCMLKIDGNTYPCEFIAVVLDVCIVRIIGVFGVKQIPKKEWNRITI